MKPARRWLAGLLGLVATFPAAAQVEVRAAERTREMAAVVVAETSLERHLLPVQQLALWLPADFTAVGPPGEDAAEFERVADGTRLRVTRAAGSPGSSLIQSMQALLESRRRQDKAVEVTSWRHLRLGDRPAIEVAGSYRAGPATIPVRLVLTADPSGDQYRSVQLEQRPPAVAGKNGAPAGEEIDVVLSRLSRDFSPLDGGIGNFAFERLRRKMVPAGPSAAFDRRNRLLAEMAQPAAVGQPWVAEQLGTLAAENPALLVDGLLHLHPRVRLACVEALDPQALAAEVRAPFYALVMQSTDPVFRFRSALRVAGTPGLAAAVVERLLESDAEIARDGLFQLLAALPPAERRQLLEASLARGLEDRSVISQTVLLAAATRWSEPATAARIFGEVARGNRHEAVRHAAYRLLLGTGEAGALTAASETLRQPADMVFAVDAAAEAWAALAPLAGAEELIGFRQGLEELGKNTTAEDAKRDLDAALAILRGFALYQEKLPPAKTAAEVLAAECRALRRHDGHAWTARRYRSLGCQSEGAPPVARLVLPQPGFFLTSLLDQAARLAVGDATQSQVYHAMLAKISEALGEWAGDPFSMASTGLDLSAPLEITWSTHESPEREAQVLDSQLSLPAGDFEVLENTLLRLAYSPASIEKVTGVFLPATQMVPLVPAALIAFDPGDDEDDEDAPPRRPQDLTSRSYYAVESGAAGERSLVLLRLVDRTTRLGWDETRLVRQGDHLVAITGPAVAAPGGAGGIPELPPALPGAEAGTSLAVDLSAFLRHFAAQAPEGDARDEVPPNLGLIIRSAFGEKQIATRLEVSGLEASWLAIAAGRPPAELAGPAELLPADTRAWLGVSFDAKALAAVLASREADFLKALGREDGAKLLAAKDLLLGEAGLALLDRDHLVGYATVDPAAADRYLDRNWKRTEKIGGLRYFRGKDVVVARLGRFLVIAEQPELLPRLATAPFFAGTPAHRDLLARLPASAALVGGFFTDSFADALKAAFTAEQQAGKPGAAGQLLSVEMLRALGPVALWLRRENALLAGEVAIEPRRLPADALPPATSAETPAIANFTKGSVATLFPGEGLIGEPWSRLELTLELPEGGAAPDFDWRGERLDQERQGPRRFHLVSRPSLPLPAASAVRLPISGAELQPFLRKEAELGMHLDSLRQLGETIRGKEQDPAKIVRAIVEWANRRLKYTVLRQEPNVEEILASRQADCTEFTRLTIALARSLGIPARKVSGIYVDEDGAILHRWAEVYLDRWYEIDSTFGEVAAPAASLRLPGLDGAFLTGSPGIRFVFESAERADGAFTRRLVLPEAPAADPAPAIAVDGGKVRLGYLGAGGKKVALESVDEGRSWTRAASAPPAGAEATATGEGGARWSVAQTAGGLVLTRRPPAAD